MATPDSGAPTPLARAAAVSWRVLVVAAAVALVGYVLVQLRIVVLPVFAALLVSSLLVPLVTRLEDRGARPLLATWTVFAVAVLLLVGIGAVIVPAVGREFQELGPQLAKGIDRVERWLVEGPAELTQTEVDRYRSRAGREVEQFVRSGSGTLLSGVFAVVEGIAGAFLALVLSFFFVKDGRRFQRWSLAHLPARHHEIARDLAERAWQALGGFLRGAAVIGAVESVVIGTTVALVGAKLAVPVAVLTFAAAFFPVVGAIAAGVVAALVTLVTAGAGPALIVAAVALVVQQVDNDLLAPLVYGRLVKLHPAVVLVTITAGGTLGGIAGAFVAVPFAAVVSAVGRGCWERWGDRWTGVTPPTSS